MLCGGKTFAGDYSKLNCSQRTKNGREPAVHPIDAETEAKWIEPPSTLTTHGQKKTMDEDFKNENRDDFPCIPDGHWIAQKKKEKGDQGHSVPGGIRTQFREEEEFLPSLDVVKSVLDLGRDLPSLGADFHFEIQLLGTLNTTKPGHLSIYNNIYYYLCGRGGGAPGFAPC